MSNRLKNFIKNLQNPADRERVAANLGIDLQTTMNTATPPVNTTGNNNNIEEVKTMSETIYGTRADGTPVTRSYAEMNIFTWWQECVSFTETGDSVYQLVQSMTMKNAPDFCITNEADYQKELARSKKLAGLN